jgi:hypothetical protein
MVHCQCIFWRLLNAAFADFLIQSLPNPSLSKTMPRQEEFSPIDFTLLEACPKCQSNWQDKPISEESRWMFGNSKWFSRVIGIYSRNRDRTIAWQCPDCGACWDRETGKPRESFNFSGTRLAAVLALLTIVPPPAMACNEPFVKAGKSCPLGYYSQGSYCVPNR